MQEQITAVGEKASKCSIACGHRLQLLTLNCSWIVFALYICTVFFPCRFEIQNKRNENNI